VAAFRQHVVFSSLLGAGYTGGLVYLGMEWVHAALAGTLCAVSGMLPDLDSASGRPVRELFGALAVGVPLLFLRRWQQTGISPEATILLAAGVYCLIRFGVAWIFKHFTVHRGMFHSVPAAVIAAEVVYLADSWPQAYGRITLAGGALLGFLSHLVLDEASSVDASGFRLRLNKAAGSAVKLASRSIPATLLTWLVLALLTYLVAVENGYAPRIHFGAGQSHSRRVPEATSDALARKPASHDGTVATVAALVPRRRAC
jgi:hypothetical protein